MGNWIDWFFLSVHNTAAAAVWGCDEVFGDNSRNGSDNGLQLTSLIMLLHDRRIFQH